MTITIDITPEEVTTLLNNFAPAKTAESNSKIIQSVGKTYRVACDDDALIKSFEEFLANKNRPKAD